MGKQASRRFPHPPRCPQNLAFVLDGAKNNRRGHTPEIATTRHKSLISLPGHVWAITLAAPPSFQCLCPWPSPSGWEVILIYNGRCSMSPLLFASCFLFTGCRLQLHCVESFPTESLGSLPRSFSTGPSLHHARYIQICLTRVLQLNNNLHTIHR